VNHPDITPRDHHGMDPLAGWAIAVTAERRAAGQAADSDLGDVTSRLIEGGEMAWFPQALRDLGADVVEIPIHGFRTLDMEAGLGRLSDAAERRELDAVTFTSQAAARNLADFGGPELVERLAAADVVCACVGPVTAAAAREAGLPHVVTATPSRLGSMIGILATQLGDRARCFELAGQTTRLQGARIAIGDRELRLTPRERTLLEAMIAAGGAVLSKRRLSQVAWAGAVSEHAVEVTVNRLRVKLGPAASALETSNRRGYRLAVA
jgi:uroporphyrinogen-III synthase